MNFNQFLSASGTYVRSLLTVVLTLILTQLANGTSALHLDWALIGNGAIVSFIPVLINALNPSNEKYGVNAKK